MLHSYVNEASIALFHRRFNGIEWCFRPSRVHGSNRCLSLYKQMRTVAPLCHEGVACKLCGLLTSFSLQDVAAWMEKGQTMS